MTSRGTLVVDQPDARESGPGATSAQICIDR